MATTVYVGMSGGVDSSVSAAILKEQGYDVVGVFMKNWILDLPGWHCPWEEDLADARSVVEQLDIELKIFDFQEEYKAKVVDYLLDGYRAGITPNPDIMCNQEIKFKLFLDVSLQNGADMIATGHYARTHDGQLYMAADANKDQTYFLARVTSKALRQTLFPLGDFASKDLVRKEATKRRLITAKKKDSVGICFVGKVGIKEFLQQFVDANAGAVIDQHGTEIGQHDGAIFYTIGQRQGLGIGGGLPYYVTGKDMDKNEVYVTTDLADPNLWTSVIKGGSPSWINQAPESDKTYQVRTRHLGKLIDASLEQIGPYWNIHLTQDQKALAPGQSAVIYNKDLCLGGVIIS